jgi:hypothetical protein
MDGNFALLLLHVWLFDRPFISGNYDHHLSETTLDVTLDELLGESKV